MAEKKDGGTPGGIAATDEATVTALGVTVSVRLGYLDDYELARSVALNGTDSPKTVFMLIDAMFGDGWPKVADELRGGDERLPMSRVAEFVSAVIEQVAELKN